MTNADKIRAMTDEELSRILSKKYCPFYFGGDTGCHTKNGGCFECWLNWLKQEVQDAAD